MGVLGSLPFGVTAPEIIVLIGGIAYVLSLIRDWRPIRTLRAENKDLRQMLSVAEQKITTLQAQVKSLEKATDLSALVAEHSKIAAVLERVVVRLDSLDAAVQAKAAAIEAIAHWGATLNPPKGDAR